MATDLTIKIPAVNIEHKVPKNQAPWKAQSISTVKKVKDNYGSQIMEASKYTGVPFPVLVAFASKESGGSKNETLKGSSKGIFQVNPSTAWQVLSDQLGQDTLGEFMPIYKLAPTLFLVKKTIPTPLGNSALESAKDYLTIRPINKTLLSELSNYLTNKDAKLISYIGALTIGQLLNTVIKKVGSPRIDHVIMMYNGGTGAFSKNVIKKGLGSSQTDSTALYNTIDTNWKKPKNEIVKDYIVMVLGINGFLDVQKQKLA